MIHNAAYYASVVLINKGKGQFEVKELPHALQTSCLNAAVFLDVNKDGFKDIVPVGNRSVLLPNLADSMVMREMYSSMKKGVDFGLLLHFQSGLDLGVTAVVPVWLRPKNKTSFIVTFNNHVPKFYEQL